MGKEEQFVESISNKLEDRTDITVTDLIKVRANYNKKKHFATTNGFANRNTLATWYLEQFIKQDGKCCYCETPQLLIRKLIDNNLLKTRTVGRNGTGRRGYSFEIERLDTIGNEYAPLNCMLSCYYCNNDKSYIFPEDDYRKFMAKSKREYFLYLENKLKK